MNFLAFISGFAVGLAIWFVLYRLAVGPRKTGGSGLVG